MPRNQHLEEGLACELDIPDQQRLPLGAYLASLILATTCCVGLLGIGASAQAAKSLSQIGHHDTTGLRGRSTPVIQHPWGLAMGPNGTLYLADVGRDQIIRRTRSGQMEVFAGDGKAGFSGDGGQATSAELKLKANSGIAVTKNGTVYIADSGNGRVRAVSPEGIIRTVAGDGDNGSFEGSKAALSVPVGPIAGLALSSTGNLYIAGSRVFELTTNGLLTSFTEPATADPSLVSVALESPDQIAFDSSGDLYISSFSNYDLYEISPNGQVSVRGNVRGEGGPGAIAAAGSTVVVATNEGLKRVEGDKIVTIDSDNRIDATLSTSSKGHKNLFFAGDGIAVETNGTTFADSNTGNAYSSVSALVEITPTGQIRVVWRS